MEKEQKLKMGRKLSGGGYTARDKGGAVGSVRDFSEVKAPVFGG